MAAVDADIWVLTETHVDMQPSPAHTAVVYSPPHPERRASHERWTAIWSRWPLNLIDDPAPHRRGTVAAVVQHPTEPFIVYGTVIAWANERHHDDGSPAGMWEVHLAEIARQGAEWRRLRSELPDLPLIVAGDFNQSQDDSNWYGTRFGRTRVREMLAASELRCHTTMDAVAHGLLTDQHLVDHICTTAELGAPTIRCLPRTDGEGQRLSDHPTVIADFPTMRPQAH